MTKEEIREMAREAGGIDVTNTRINNITVWLGTGTFEFLEAFAKLVAEKERQWLIDSGLIGVLKHCENLLRENGHDDAVDDVQNMIAKIKTRGQANG